MEQRSSCIQHRGPIVVSFMGRPWSQEHVFIAESVPTLDERKEARCASGAASFYPQRNIILSIADRLVASESVLWTSPVTQYGDMKRRRMQYEIDVLEDTFRLLFLDKLRPIYVDHPQHCRHRDSMHR